MSLIFFTVTRPNSYYKQLYRSPLFHLLCRTWTTQNRPTLFYFHYVNSCDISFSPSTWHLKQQKMFYIYQPSWVAILALSKIALRVTPGVVLETSTAFQNVVVFVCFDAAVFLLSSQSCFVQNPCPYLFCGWSSCFIQKFAFTAISWANVKLDKFLAAAISSSNVTILGGLAAGSNKIKTKHYGR